MRWRGPLQKMRLAAFPEIARRPGGRIVILDPGLQSAGGHHFPMAAALIQETRGLGREVVIVGHAQLSREVHALGAIPYFTQSGYAKSAAELDREADRGAAGAARLGEANAQLLVDLSALPRDWFDENDFVLFPTVTPNQILAIGQWISGFAASSSPCWGLSLLLSPEWGGGAWLREAGFAYARAAFDVIPPPLARRIVVSCEAAVLAKTYASHIGREPIVQPLPLHADIDHTHRTASARGQNGKTGPLVASLGYVNEAKGFDLLPDILPLVAAAHPGAHFLVHASGGSRKWRDSLRERLESRNASTTFVGRQVSQERMIAML
ncbi:MAG: hypothetical protein KAT39_13890, partial [Alphaproteobacteria bacterium]|nr:hypothetical protein [Alphaproteobacteria bacterium]